MPKIIQSLVVKSALSCALLHLALFLALSITLSFALYFSLSLTSRAFGPLKIPTPEELERQVGFHSSTQDDA